MNYTDYGGSTPHFNLSLTDEGVWGEAFSGSITRFALFLTLKLSNNIGQHIKLGVTRRLQLGL